MPMRSRWGKHWKDVVNTDISRLRRVGDAYKGLQDRLVFGINVKARIIIPLACERSDGG
jgi:hypothetical protein